MKSILLSVAALTLVMQPLTFAQTNLTVRNPHVDHDALLLDLHTNATGWLHPWQLDYTSGSCTGVSPCGSVQYAYSIAPAGASIHVADPGDFTWFAYDAYTMNITRSVTIDVSGVGEPCPFPIVVNAGPNDLVVLRGFTFNNFTGFSGIPITVVSGKVRIENLKITGAASHGVWVQSGTVMITNSTIDSANDGVWALGPGSLTLDNVQITNSANIGLLMKTYSGWMKGTVRNSTFTGNSSAISVFDNGILTVENSIVTLNSYALTVWAGTVMLSNATITDNGTAFSALQGGQIVSFVNNRIYGNVNAGVPTVSAYQK